MTEPGPFLRWAGGKRQLLGELLAELPDGFHLSTNRYFEPFIGGGAVMFALAGTPAAAGLAPTRRKTGRPIVINDVNPDLANTYTVLRDQPADLIAALGELAGDTTEARYYEMRAHVPTDPVDAAARTIYLNRTTFNGLYRQNSAGQFNVPWGRLANPTICNTELLEACSQWLSHAEIRCGSFIAAVADAAAGDVVYLDPPYVPLTPTASFSKYAKDDFGEMDQWALAGVIRGLLDRGAHVILSNSDTELTRRIYGDDLELRSVNASRSVSASAASRASVLEVIGAPRRSSQADAGTVPAMGTEPTPPTPAPAPIRPVVADGTGHVCAGGRWSNDRYEDCAACLP